MRAFLLFTLSLFILASPELARAKVLGAGDDIPGGFTAVDSLGRNQTFQQLKGNHGLVLLFTRSADWCQYCKAQLRDWNEKLAAVKEAGYALAAMSYDSPEQLARFAEANKLGYTLLSDTNSAMINAFGIRNTKFDEGSRFYGIPNPAIYVIDETGTISHVFREANYQERPTIDEVIAALSGKVEATPNAEEGAAPSE